MAEAVVSVFVSKLFYQVTDDFVGSESRCFVELLHGFGERGLVLCLEDDVDDFHGGDVVSFDGDDSADFGVCLCEETVA